MKMEEQRLQQQQLELKQLPVCVWNSKSSLLKIGCTIDDLMSQQQQINIIPQRCILLNYQNSTNGIGKEHHNDVFYCIVL